LASAFFWLAIFYHCICSAIDIFDISAFGSHPSSAFFSPPPPAAAALASAFFWLAIFYHCIYSAILIFDISAFGSQPPSSFLSPPPPAAAGFSGTIPAARSAAAYLAFCFLLLAIFYHCNCCIIVILDISALGSQSSSGSLGLGGLSNNAAALASCFLALEIFYHYNCSAIVI